MNSVDETKFPTKILSKADKEIKLPLVLETQMMKSFGFFARYYGIVYFVMLCFFFRSTFRWYKWKGVVEMRKHKTVY